MTTNDLCYNRVTDFLLDAWSWVPMKDNEILRPMIENLILEVRRLKEAEPKEAEGTEPKESEVL